MTYFPLTGPQREWKERTAEIACQEIGPRAAAVDKEPRYPTESLEALRKAGLWGLRVSKEHGGLGADLLSTVLVVEEIAKKCPSTAMCYKMHLEASEVISRVPTPDQVTRFVEPLGRGEILATVAGSESHGAGDNWTASPVPSTIERAPGGYRLDCVRKSYVTSAGHATHYFFLCRIGADAPNDAMSLLYVERDAVEWEILEPWQGMGLRGNASSPMRFSGFVPEANRIGAEHTAMADARSLFWPVLGVTYAAAYLGIASGAFELACQEGDRRFPSGARRLDNPINQRRMAELSARIEAARTMLHAAAALFDRGELPSMLPVLQAKVLCSEAAVQVTQDLMTIFGGTAFAGLLPFERYFRDARAGLVMGLANDSAYQMIGGLLFPHPSP